METREQWNPDIPIETLYKWKLKECNKLKQRLDKLESTVKALRNNLRLIIDDPEARRAVREEARVRMMIKERNELDKKLHTAYNDREELIIKLNQLRKNV